MAKGWPKQTMKVCGEIKAWLGNLLNVCANFMELSTSSGHGLTFWSEEGLMAALDGGGDGGPDGGECSKG